MTLDEYQEQARDTAIYPRGHAIIYPALGLAGEAGETCEKVKKWLRDDKGEMTEQRREAIRDEAADVLWYVANLLADLGFTLDEAAQANVDKLRSRKERGRLMGEGDRR